jgi:hypothetical protein
MRRSSLAVTGSVLLAGWMSTRCRLRAVQGTDPSRPDRTERRIELRANRRIGRAASEGQPGVGDG